MTEIDSHPRNYIKRKRCFNDCVKEIEKTLTTVFQKRNENKNESEIKQIAKQYAKSIEAACWAPRSNMTDEKYKTLVTNKTTELCFALSGKGPTKGIFDINLSPLSSNNSGNSSTIEEIIPDIDCRSIFFKKSENNPQSAPSSILNSLFKDVDDIESENQLVSWDFTRQRLYSDPYQYMY